MVESKIRKERYVVLKHVDSVEGRAVVRLADTEHAALERFPRHKYVEFQGKWHHVIYKTKVRITSNYLNVMNMI